MQGGPLEQRARSVPRGSSPTSAYLQQCARSARVGDVPPRTAPTPNPHTHLHQAQLCGRRQAGAAQQAPPRSGRPLAQQRRRPAAAQLVKLLRARAGRPEGCAPGRVGPWQRRGPMAAGRPAHATALCTTRQQGGWSWRDAPPESRLPCAQPGFPGPGPAPPAARGPAARPARGTAGRLRRPPAPLSPVWAHMGAWTPEAGRAAALAWPLQHPLAMLPARKRAN